MRQRFRWARLPVTVGFVAAVCGGAGRARAQAADPAGVPAVAPSVEHYVAQALAGHPRLETAYQRWLAARHHAAAAGPFPEVVVSYGYFLQRVETRVGPQRHRVSVSQRFPWPARLRALDDAAASRAVAWRRRYEATALAVREEVARAYWELWFERESGRVLGAQVELINVVLEVARARVAVGSSSVADVQRLELDATRLRDRAVQAEARARVGQVQLAASVGVEPVEPVAVASIPPRLERVTEPRDALLAAANRHPELVEFDARAQAFERDARAHRIRARPSLRLGVDWIETGRGAAAVTDAGKDPVLIHAAVAVPLAQRKLAAQAEASRALARTEQSARRARLVAATAEIDRLLVLVDDTRRRAAMYEQTLIPQARATFDAVVGAYAGGQGSVAAVLAVERELLEFEVELARTRVDHAVAWAGLERAVGRPVVGVVEFRS
ncbi:MAG: TolC family protein [Myxococcales bacterium FL481]|nr:MAG: TolC family protein [Myxococcales bacterium FL481]